MLDLVLLVRQIIDAVKHRLVFHDLPSPRFRLRFSRPMRHEVRRTWLRSTLMVFVCGSFDQCFNGIPLGYGL